MAKMPEEITVGIVTKVMTHIGYGVFTKKQGVQIIKIVYKTREEAEAFVESSIFNLEIKPLYIEESPK